MILSKKKTIEMLEKIREKILNKQELETEEIQLITTLIIYTIGDLNK